MIRKKVPKEFCLESHANYSESKTYSILYTILLNHSPMSICERKNLLGGIVNRGEHFDVMYDIFKFYVDTLSNPTSQELAKSIVLGMLEAGFFE